MAGVAVVVISRVKARSTFDGLMLPAVAGVSESQRPDIVAVMAKAFCALRQVTESLFGFGRVPSPDFVANLSNVPSSV
jgi:hypothetical protein